MLCDPTRQGSGPEKAAKQGSRSAASPLGGATEPGVAPDCSGAVMGVQGPMLLLVVLLVCVALGKPGELRRCPTSTGMDGEE